MYAFGAFELDPHSHELRRGGVRIKIQDQPFLILVKLLERPGALVTRDELRSALWNGDTFVDFDTGLNSAVKRLREALGDSAEVPKYIETVPKRGYRFIATVESASPQDSQENRKARTDSRMRWAGVAVVVVAAAMVAVFIYLRKTERPSGTTISEIVPLTGMTESEVWPAFSPDGNQVAYIVSGKEIEKSGVFVKVMGGERPLHLTTNPDDCCPVWSPDGRSIAFVRGSTAEFTIYVLPALGGTPRKVFEERSEYRGEHIDMPPVFSWSPDGNHLALSLPSGPKKQPKIALVSLVDSSTRVITSPPPEYSDWLPSISPDGNFIAFRRSSGLGGIDDLYVMPSGGGEARRLTYDNRPIWTTIAWTPDSREIIFASARGGLVTLWRIEASGGEARRVEGVGAPVLSPAVSLKGQRLAYTSYVSGSSLWLLRLGDDKRSAGTPQMLLSSKNQLSLPYFSADGRKIVFESIRTGYEEIWTMNVDGSSEAQLTHLNGNAGTPRWSHDGRFVAFDYRPKEHSEIYQIDGAGGTARLVPTVSGADNVVPRWSHDDKWIYFASSRGNEPTQVWKVPAAGGAAIQLTKNGGVGPVESTDGFVYYSRSLDSDEILRIPAEGGEETPVMTGYGLDGCCGWALMPTGVYFIGGSAGEAKGRQLKFFDFRTKKASSLMVFQKNVIDLAVSPDGKSLVYSEMDQEDNTIMLVNGFR
jgi:Tol biopolymer transport system component/DNA-binding winged helix-turn-helix (wHTH) protein